MLSDAYIQRISSYTVSTYNVLFDKLASNFYCSSAPEESNINLTQTKVENFDKMTDYKEFTQPEKYNDESKSTRLYDEENWFEKLKSSYYDPVLIIDNIYLGGAVNAGCKAVLDDCGIKLVINCAAEIRNYFEGEIEYKKYSLYDDNINSIAEALDKAYEAIDNFQKSKQGNIFVHCMMGRSRSVAVVLYYIMRKLRKYNGTTYTFDEAIEFVKSKKSNINPTFRMAKDVMRAAIKILMDRDNLMTNENDEFAIEINSSIYNDINSSIMNSGSIMSSVIEDYAENNENDSIKNNDIDIDFDAINDIDDIDSNNDSIEML